MAGGVPAIQWIDDARGEFGRGEMEDGVGRLLALADAAQQRQTGQIIDVSDAIPGVDWRPDDARRNGANADIVLAELGGQLKSERMTGALAGDRRTGREGVNAKRPMPMANVNETKPTRVMREIDECGDMATSGQRLS